MTQTNDKQMTTMKLVTYQFPFSKRCACSASMIVIEWRLLFLSVLCCVEMWFSLDISSTSLIRWWWWWWWCLRRECSFRDDFRGELTKLPFDDGTDLTTFLLLELIALVLNIRFIWCTSNDWFPCDSLGCSLKFWTLKITHQQQNTSN